MRKSLIAIVALIPALALRADEPKSSYSVTTDFTYVSEYIFRGVEQQDQALQPSVTVTAGDLSLGVWTSQALNHRSLSWAQGSEVDVFGSYGFKLNDSVSLSLGGTAYLYPSARASLGEPDSTYEGSLGVTFPVGPVSGGATYFHDFKLKANTFLLGLSYSMALPQERASMDFSASYGFNNIDDGNGDLPGTGGVDYRFYGVDAVLNFTLTAAAKLKIGAHYTDVSRLAGAPGANLWFSVGVTTGL